MLRQVANTASKMDIWTPDTSAKRIGTYCVVGVCLTIGYAQLRGATWQGTVQLHTLMETVAMLLALIVGVMALVRFYSKKNNTFLFIGTGFLGTAFLDGYHAVVTSAFFETYMPSDLAALIPWTWVASRQFLSILLFMSFLAWLREKRLGEAGRIGEGAVYLFSGVLALASLLFFAFAPLPRAYYPELVFHRPEEFLPALFFLIALVGYLHKGAWRHDPFEHWLVLSLIVGVVGQAVFMSFSGQIFDFESDAAHVLKNVSYVCVLIGLMISTYSIFRAAEEGSGNLTAANAQLHREVAERKLAQQELARSNAELEQFAYVASHDLKAPLRGIGNLAGWIEEDLQDVLEGETRENMDLIRGRVKRLEGILDDLLEYSRAGRQETEVTFVDTRDLVTEIAELLSPPDGLVISSSVTLPRFETTVGPLRQVLLNLINNAIKHHDRANGHIEVAAIDQVNNYEFTVADDGPGIPPKFHERIFGMFQTLRPRDEVEGSGMGLSIVKKIIEKSGGTISVASDPEQRGSVFRFTWPKRQLGKAA